MKLQVSYRLPAMDSQSEQKTAPEWLRVPAPGKSEPFTGLRRNVLYDLLKSGKVRSVLIRKPGAMRGVRLIDARSLIGYLDKLADEQATSGNTFDGFRTAAGKEGAA